MLRICWRRFAPESRVDLSVTTALASGRMSSTQANVSDPTEREIAASRRAEREHSEALARLSAAREETTRAEREVFAIQEEEKQLRADLARVGEDRAKALELSAQKTGEMTAMEAAIAGLETVPAPHAFRPSRPTARRAPNGTSSARGAGPRRRRSRLTAAGPTPPPAAWPSSPSR